MRNPCGTSPNNRLIGDRVRAAVGREADKKTPSMLTTCGCCASNFSRRDQPRFLGDVRTRNRQHHDAREQRPTNRPKRCDSCSACRRLKVNWRKQRRHRRREHCSSGHYTGGADGPKNNFPISRPLTPPSPARGEGLRKSKPHVRVPRRFVENAQLGTTEK